MKQWEKPILNSLSSVKTEAEGCPQPLTDFIGNYYCSSCHAGPWSYAVIVSNGGVCLAEDCTNETFYQPCS